MSSQLPQSDLFYIRLLKFLSHFLLTLGGIAGGYGIAQKVTQDSALQIVVAMVAGLLAYALGFVNKVWQKLEGPLVDKIAVRVPSFFKNRFAGYHQQYLNYISHAHRVLEFSGLIQRPAYNRGLERIFVEPTITPIPPHLAPSHPLKHTQHLHTSDSHDIWHFLSDNMLDSAIFVLLGAAGSGKTTLIKHIAFSLSQARLRSRLLRKHRLQQSFPVLLYLRDHLSTIKDKPECTLPELVQSSVQSKGHVAIPLQWFEQQFKRGKCLVMLDGLDEAADEEAHKLIVKWIQSQFLAYPKNRFILTARPHGYVDTPLDDALVFNIQPFSPTQIRTCIKQWFLIDELMRSEQNDPGVQLRASESTGNLSARLNQKPSLLELAANPLLLTMITTLASTGGSLPNDRLELYREIFQALLYRRRDAVGLTPKLSVQQKLEVLQPLASHMMHKRLLELEYDRLRQIITPHLAQVSSELTAEGFLKDIEQNSGVLLDISTGIWGFAHKTFQEYLAANDLKEERKESTLIKHIDDDWWHETICFYSAQVDATKIIQACLAQADTSAQMLNLALECNSQKLKADVAITQKVAPEYKNLEELVLDQLLLDRAKALSYDRVQARDQREPIDETLELERELNEMQAPDVNPLLAHGIRVQPLAFSRSYFASDISSETIKVATPTVSNYLNLLNKRSSSPYTEEEKYLRWFTRYQSQVHARRAYFAIQHTVNSHKQQQSLLLQHAQEKSLLEQEFAFYRRLCIDFALLELREKGKLPPWEAILLTKERQQV